MKKDTDKDFSLGLTEREAAILLALMGNAICETMRQMRCGASFCGFGLFELAILCRMAAKLAENMEGGAA